MFGFFGSYGKNGLEYDTSSFNENCIRKEYSHNNFSVQQISLNKFQEDKLLVETADFVLLTEGVILNADELSVRCFSNTFQESIPILYQQFGKTFFNEFRGSFSGVLFEKNDNTCIVFNDQTGSKLLFYTSLGQNHYFASDLQILFSALNKRNAFQYDKQFAFSLLTYGYSPTYHTIIETIRRVPAGHFLQIRDGVLELKQYHRFTNTSNTLSLKENIENLDALFRRAVARGLKKNEHYGYDNVLPLSAGLDSRLTTCVAKKLTDKSIKNVTYSQSGYYDDAVPKEISKFLGNESIFTPLDGGNYLKRIDESIKMTCGVIHYSCPAQVIEGFKTLDPEKIGIILTGMYGNGVIGTYSTQKSYTQKPFYGSYAYSKKYLQLLEKYLSQDFLLEYPNMEVYALYLLGFSCENLGSPIAFQNFTESYSPYCDVDLLQYAFSIPLKYRWSYRLYDTWILEKYPEMAKWAHNGTRKIGSFYPQISLLNRKIPLRDVPERLLKYILKKSGVYNFENITQGNSMNPIDSWLKENASLKTCFDDYMNNNIQKLQFEATLQETACKLYEQGTGMEQMQVITLLGNFVYLDLP